MRMGPRAPAGPGSTTLVTTRRACSPAASSMAVSVAVAEACSRSVARSTVHEPLFPDGREAVGEPPSATGSTAEGSRPRLVAVQ